MRILFVYTDINTMGFGGRSYHFGIGILSSILKQKGHQTKLCYVRTKPKIKDIFKEIKSFNPDIIAFTSDTTQIGYVKKILLALAGLKDIFTVLGGCHASLVPESLTQIIGLNAICLGEGEETLTELADSLKNAKRTDNIRGLWLKTKEGKIIKNPMRPFIANLDALPFSDYELFDYQKVIDSDFGRLSFMLSRGCPFNCTFCASPSLGKLQEGNYVRFMSTKRAVAELGYLKSRYSFKTIFFADDIFTVNKDYVSAFCQEYKKRINLPFEANSRVETASEEIFKLLKDSGCFKVHMGVESGDELFRKETLNRKMSNEQIIDAFNCAKSAGLLTKSYNIVGFPQETLKIHQATIELNKRINPDGHVCYIFQPYPGTKLYELCKNNSYIKKDYEKDRVISRRDTILEMPDFPSKEIIRCQRNFSFQIYKSKSLQKAWIYKIYYSRYGEFLLRLFSPIKNFLRDLAFKRGNC